ncbi:MAG: c-type cytochrome [Hyphomicrobiaceae bacterium]|nr:c-type cytochrome [Hyphomicrobiaceae bacterium]
MFFRSNRTSRPISVALAAVILTSTVLLAPAAAESEIGAIARGGRLYDNWYGELKMEKPAETHPAWPQSNTKQKGASTWRCKSCHGWDYMGKDGAYSTGSYQTGIPGIRALEGGEPAAIAAVLGNATHGLAGKLGEQDIKDLSLFVSKGQVDHDTFIDRATKAIKDGDAVKGAAYYSTVCAGCHGKDGASPEEMPDSLGLLISKNPWETLHKVMNGQPHEPMPAMRAFDGKVMADVLAYVATLPKKSNPAKK